ncbi:protein DETOXIFICATION 16 isoform X2 [Physcomitrium patens]|uniref:Protein DETOXIFICATION n=1 Tax=Physcomitrium patens TaxID=3218 RepID=A0A7I4A7F5_PHYPA|nr:protein DETOXIFICATION 16-like isoform X2 [Physcomitrium patens]|eukprot:XP_024387711.1 protein DETOXIFICATION 16-like isoform X2 [Physcomitrella patens]
MAGIGATVLAGGAYGYRKPVAVLHHGCVVGIRGSFGREGACRCFDCHFARRCPRLLCSCKLVCSISLKQFHSWLRKLVALLLNWIQEREETHEKKGILNLLEIASLERSLKLGLGSALETLCGQAFGAGPIHHHMLGIFLQRALVVLYGACIPISFLFIYMEHILLLLGQDPHISEKAGEYALCLLPSIYGYALLQPVVKFLQTQSVVLPMMICSAGSLALHVGISYTLVYMLGLGFRGAALATSLSFWLNAIFLVCYVRFSGVCKHTWEGFSKNAFVDLREFLGLAIPSCIMICLEYWCFEVLVILAGLLPNPELELATLSVCLTTTSLNYMIPFGLSAAASTRVSNELGAGDAPAAKQAVVSVVSLSATQALVISSVLLSLRHQWAWLFSGDAEVVDSVAEILPFVACIALLDGIQGVLSGVARGCGWQELGAIINLGAFYGVGVPTSALLAFEFNFGGRGLFLGLICGLATQTLILLCVTLRTDWERQVRKVAARILHEEADLLEDKSGERS